MLPPTPVFQAPPFLHVSLRANVLTLSCATIVALTTLYANDLSRFKNSSPRAGRFALHARIVLVSSGRQSISATTESATVSRFEIHGQPPVKQCFARVNRLDDDHPTYAWSTLATSAPSLTGFNLGQASHIFGHSFLADATKSDSSYGLLGPRRPAATAICSRIQM